MTDGGSSGSEVSVVPDDVRALGNFAYQLAQDIKAALDSAGHDADKLTSTGWLGPAGKAFGAGWSECNDGGQKVLTALTTMAEKLGVTATSYDARDTQTAADVSSLLPSVDTVIPGISNFSNGGQ